MTKKDTKVDVMVQASGVDVVRLAADRKQASELATFLRDAPCESVEQEQWFSQQRANVGALIKVLEEERKKITGPLNSAKLAVDALFRPARQPLEECEAIILDKLRGAAQRRLEAEATARLAAETAAVQGDALAVIEAAASMPERVVTEGSSAGWKYEAVVVDFAALPDTLKIANVALLDGLGRDAKAAGSEPPVIPGVEFRKVAVVRRKG